MKCYMYILECCDGSYYTGSTKHLKLRLTQHQNGQGANHTRKRLPIKLVYCEEFDRIDHAFFREKQVQGWSRKKKEALIKGELWKLPELAKSAPVVSTSSTTLRRESILEGETNLRGGTILEGETTLRHESILEGETTLRCESILESETNFRSESILETETNLRGGTILTDSIPAEVGDDD